MTRNAVKKEKNQVLKAEWHAEELTLFQWPWGAIEEFCRGLSCKTERLRQQSRELKRPEWGALHWSR